MSKSPAFQFYPADYLADENVQMMTCQEEGQYIRLMAYCWREGSIPADPEKLKLLCKGEPVGTAVRDRFTPVPTDASRLVHLRLERERDKQAKFQQSQAKKGVLSGKARRNKRLDTEPRFNHGSTSVEPNGTLRSSSSFSSSGLRTTGPGAVEVVENQSACGASSSQSFSENSNPPEPGKKKTRQQERFAIIGKLAQRAEEILRQNPDENLGDLAEKLKQWAASRSLTYFDGWPNAASPIEQAITIGLERSGAKQTLESGRTR